jgi:hypothetical protein
VVFVSFGSAWRFWGTLPSDITPHVLRHSFASVAADLGYSESTIAGLVGHSGRSITSRYIHPADAVLLAAADAVAERTLTLMGKPTPYNAASGTSRPSTVAAEMEIAGVA